MSMQVRVLALQDRLNEAERLRRMAGRVARLGGWRVELSPTRLIWSAETAAIHEEPETFSPTLEQGLQYYAPEYHERIRRVFRQCARVGEPFNETAQIITARGRRVWVRSIGEAVRDAQGAIVAVEGAFQDISELMAAREQASSLDRRLSQTLESISDAFYLLDANWHFVFVNTQAEVLLQRPRAQMLGQHVWQLFPEAAAQGSQIRRAYERAVALGQSVRFDEFYPPLQTWFEISAYPTPEGLAVYFHDVTRLRAEQQQLRLLEFAVARQRDMLIITEAEPVDQGEMPRMVYVNDALLKRTGYRREELLGQQPSWLHGPDTDPVALAAMRQALRSQSPMRTELLNYTKAGEGYWVELDMLPLHNSQGLCTHWLAVARDITEKKALEANQRDLERRLHQAQKLEAVGQLTGGVAHDFNNLLTVILGSAELLEDGLEAAPALQRLAQTTRLAAERGAELTSRLLAFARKQPLQPQVANLNTLLAGIEPLLLRTLGEHVQIEVVRGAGLWLTEVDPGQLEAALLNLAINARDAMSQGGRLTIETANAALDDTYVRAEPDVAPGQYVQLTVSDTGQGIPRAVLGRVFEPFFTTKPVGKGSGLGLSMVYGFVKQSQGHIRVYSEPGEGTSVKLYFPRSHQSRPANTAGVSSAPDLQGGNETILVVEDDSLVRQHLVAQLRLLGYQVLSAGSARDALELLRHTTGVQLLFTDVIMPGDMNGKQLADQVQARYPGLKILFTSGYTENAIVHHGRLDPGVKFLSKPYRREQLAQKIRQTLDT